MSNELKPIPVAEVGRRPDFHRDSVRAGHDPEVGNISLSHGTHDGLSGHDPNYADTMSIEKFRRWTAIYHDPEHPERDIHGVDHGAMQGIAHVSFSGDNVVIKLNRAMNYSEFVTLQDHLRSWHPCVGFAEGK